MRILSQLHDLLAAWRKQAPLVGSLSLYMVHMVQWRGNRAAFRSFACRLALAAALGCGHTEPFGSVPLDRDQPFDATPPVRLTLNRGADHGAAWVSDGSAIMYSTQPVGRSDHDVCLALLPATGGGQRQLTCDLFSTSTTRTDALESPAPAPDGRLAFVAGTSAIGAALPETQAIVLASVGDPVTHQVLQSVPYTIPGRRRHLGISQMRWLGPSRLLFLGEAVTFFTPCPFCGRDTLRSGLDAVWLNVDGTPTPQAIAGTDYASGVSPGASEDEVYYTIGGDTRVYRQLISTGVVSVVHDFGAAGIARDVHVVGGRLAAVVGGRVAYAVDSTLGPTQWDSGGVLHVVTIQDGSDVILDGPGLFRRPQLSPSGSGLVAEVYPLIITNSGLGLADTTVSKVADLYSYGQP